MKATIIFCFLFLLPLISKAEYVIPIADNQNSSPPSISGVIKSIDGTTINIASNGKITSITTNSETQIFTIYGGRVLLKQLCNAGTIEVWYTKASPDSLSPLAAAIRVQQKCI